MNKSVIGALLCALSLHASAVDTLKLCAAEDELPYANAKGQGFEDRIAEIIASKLGMTLERVGYSDPRHVVRELLDKGKCDVMIGTDTGDPRVATTPAYYRSSYVFVTRADYGHEVRDWKSEILGTARIGVIPGTPAEVMLTQIGRYPDMFSYLMALGGNKAPRNRYVKYSTEKLIRDVASGDIDVAVAWAPAVARYIKASPTPLKVNLVPAEARKANGEPVLFQYDTSIAVSKTNPGLLHAMEGALVAARSEIQATLDAEGVLQVLAPTASLTQSQKVSSQ